MEDIHQKILDDIKCRESWCQPLVLPHSNKIINLSNAIGKNPTTPPDAPDQPNRYIQQSKYQLDKYFKGIEMFDEVKLLIKKACPECILVQNRGKGESMSCHRWQLSCSCCFTVDECVDDFEDGFYAKRGVKEETVKQQRSSGGPDAVDRMKNQKERNNSKKKSFWEKKRQSKKKDQSCQSTM